MKPSQIVVDRYMCRLNVGKRFVTVCSNLFSLGDRAYTRTLFVQRSTASDLSDRGHPISDSPTRRRATRIYKDEDFPEDISIHLT